jgi:hypothetical protein
MSDAAARVPSMAELVKAAQATAPRQKGSGGFSLTTAGVTERIIAPLVGVLLGWTVARLPEVFPEVAVPRLPLILLATFLVLLTLAIPFDGWRRMWQASVPLRCVAGLFTLALVTAPLGIWIGGSITFIQERYLVAVVVFLACLVFLRDRRAFRAAMRIYVLCVTLIATFTLKTYDPNAVFIDADGQVVDLSEMSIEQQRIKVGISLDSNDWGAVLATTVPIALWLSAGSLLRRVVWGGAALILAAAVVPTASRGSLLGLVAVALVLIAVGATGWRRLLLLSLTLAGGLVFAAIASEGQTDRFLDFGGDDYNLTNEGRIYFWRQGLVWMIKRPWGYGIGNYPVYFGWLNGADRAAHSSWVQYGMELGVAGISLFALLCYTLVQLNRRNRQTALGLRPWLGRGADDEAILAGHMLAVLAGTLLTGSFLSNAYYPLMYMALGLAGAAALGFPLNDAARQLAATTTPPPEPMAIAPRRDGGHPPVARATRTRRR